MRGQHGGGVHHGVTRHDGLGAHIRADPARVHAKGGVLAGAASDLFVDITAVDRQHVFRPDHVFADHGAANGDAIGIGIKRQIILDAHQRNDETQLLGQLLPDTGHALHQRRILALVDQGGERVADLDAQHRFVRHVAPVDGAWIGGGGFGYFFLGLWPGKAIREIAGHGGRGQNHHVRHAGQHAQDRQDDGYGDPGLVRSELRGDLSGQIERRGYAGHDRGCGDRQQQGRDLRHQRIADGEHGIGGRGLADIEPMADHAEHDAAENVDDEDQHAGDRIALHELAGTIHRTVEIGLGRHVDAALLGFFRRDEARAKIGVDGHLLAGQGIQGETCTNFRHAARTLGDDDHVDDHQDGKDEQADDIVAADQHGAKGFDHMAGRIAAFMAGHQHDAGGGDVEAKPQQRCKQQHRWKAAEVQRLGRVQRHHQHRERNHDVGDEPDVEHKGGHRQYQEHDQQQRGHRQQGRPDIQQSAESGTGCGGRGGFHVRLQAPIDASSI